MSNLGPVLDISAGGIRVLSPRKPRGKQRIVLEGRTGKVVLSGEIVWAERLGFRRYEVGVHFLDVDEEMSQVLTDIASTHSRSQYWKAA